MIEIINLSKNYGKKKALDNISFKINSGEIVGFLGPNGAGKSTTMNIITGYISSTSGKVLVNNHDIIDEPEIVKKAIGYLPEQPPLYMDMTVDEYLNFVAGLKGVKRKEVSDEVSRVKRVVKIDSVSKRLIRNLSKGYRQRVGIAQAILGNSEVLILDEPTVGLDPKQIIEIRELIRELGKKHTVILSSHILSEIQAVCDRVIIINAGKIVEDKTLKELETKLHNNHLFTVSVEAEPNELISEFRRIPNVIDCHLLSTNNNISKVELTVGEHFDTRNIFFAMSNKKWPIVELINKEASLEDLFIKLVNTNVSEM